MSRKLDAAIAEALGYEVFLVDEYLSEFMESTKYKLPVINYIDNNDYEHIPHYSTDGNAMLELDKEMLNKGFGVYVCYESDGMFYGACYDNSHMLDGNEEIDCVSGGGEDKHSEPLARALAAYEALTGKEWSE